MYGDEERTRNFTFTWKSISGLVAGVILALWIVIWLAGSENPQTPAGYGGYLTQGAIFGKTRFYGVQLGPTSPGRTWLLSVTNVSITPYTYDEDFTDDKSVLSRDNLKISFSVHIVWRIKSSEIQAFVERFSTISPDDNPEKIVKIAYNNYIKEPLRTYSRDEIQKLNGLEIKDRITPAGQAIYDRVQQLVAGTPFEVTSVVVGNIQYPAEVADAVAAKMAMTQVLERKETEISVEEKEKEIRIIQAEGIAASMEIIRGQLSPQYLQHEAIEAQKLMVNSPNNTVVYIPVGNLGVPLVGAIDMPSPKPGTSKHPIMPDTLQPQVPKTQ